MTQRKNRSKYGACISKVPSPAAVQLNPYKVQVMRDGVVYYGGVHSTPAEARAAVKAIKRVLDRVSV